MSVSEVAQAHELDAAWIIALWKKIHGGDPSVETVAGEVIAAMAQYLRGAEYSFTFSQMEKQFASLGIKVTEHSEKAKDVKTRAIEGPLRRGVRDYCFQVGGQTICAQIPDAREEAA